TGVSVANCLSAARDVMAGLSVSGDRSCANAIYLNQSPAAGTLVGPGPHTITVTAIDQAGNIGTCTTTFTVSDTTAPVVTCAANQIGRAACRERAAVPDAVAGGTAKDNCSPTNPT